MKISNISKIIKEERKKKGLTQPQLATLAGVSITSLRAIEQGTYSPNVETLNKILNLFNYEVGAVEIEK